MEVDSLSAVPRVYEISSSYEAAYLPFGDA